MFLEKQKIKTQGKPKTPNTKPLQYTSKKPRGIFKHLQLKHK